jgi:hypothetical protein
MEWKIFGIDGTEKAFVKELELHDEWMAECYLSVNVKSANPINFAIGDYIDYRGERYCINYDPSVLKKARRGSYGEGFTYDSIKFVSEPQSKIVDCDFTDLVLNDNQLHYTGLPTFPFYCETVDDLLDRIQACLEEIYPGQFVIIGLNTLRNRQRGSFVGRQSDFVNAYKKYVDPTGAENYASYGNTSVAITVDDITCWEAVTKINTDFALNFIMRGNVLVAGVDGVFTPSTFRYGKGKGLYEIERISDSDQQIVTRLKAYGSEDNLPSRYYAELNLKVFANVEKIDSNYATSKIHYATFWLDLDFNTKYFTERSKSYPGSNDSPNYIIRMTANGITVTGYITKASDSNRCYVYSEYTSDGSDDRDETDEAAMNAFSEAIKQGDTIYFVSGIKKDAFPTDNKIYGSENLPNNMSMSRLMLPGFPNQSLYDWVKAHGGTDCNDATGQATINGFTGIFSKDKHRPWLQSMKAEVYGIRPGNVYFDGSNETENIHPTIEGMKSHGIEVDVVSSADQIADNGVFGEGKVPNFTITLPDLGFNLTDYYQDGASIDMKDGMCGSRSFRMASKPVRKNGGWECNVERVKDDSLDLWFPYSDFQISSGDHYVLSGINLPDAYVNAASEKMLYAAIEVIEKNDSTQFTYQPHIDELWMARQHDEAVKSETTSIHDTIHAGDIFLFEDEDLGIDEGIIIDVLTIKENSSIPTYEVTLRNEKQVNSIQRMIDKAISNSNASGGGNGGGYTSRQIQSLIENYGGTQFLSKMMNDSAQGVISFLKGLNFEKILRSKNAMKGFLDGKGIILNADDGTIEADGLNIRGFMRVMELAINRLQLMESDYSFTEGDTTERVDFSDGGQRMVLTMHKDHDNDHTPFYPGDILYAKINDLLDHGTYYTSWVRVISVDHTNNTIKVVPWPARNNAGGIEVPGGKNYTFIGTEILYNDATSAVAEDYETFPDGYEKIINLTRHGNVADGLEDGDNPSSYSEDVLASQKARQQSWVLSTTDKRLSFFWNVDNPIMDDDNYALCLGILPELDCLPHDEFGNPSWKTDMPSLFINSIFYAHSHKINWPAKIIKEDRGQWTATPTATYTGETGTRTPDGTLDAAIATALGWTGEEPLTFTNGQQINEPYHFEHITRNRWLTVRLNSVNNRYSDADLYKQITTIWTETNDLETSRVWNNGILWECLVDTTTQEPTWGCTDWKVIGGDTVYYCEIASSAGTTFRNGNVDTVLTMSVRYGLEDITAKVAAIAGASISWSRYTGFDTETRKFIQTSEDKSWHAISIPGSPYSIRLSRSDLGSGWMVDYRIAMIHCSIYAPDDLNTIEYPADFITQI